MARDRSWRAQGDERGFDELVVEGRIHLESMGGNDWFLRLGGTEGTSVGLWFRFSSDGDLRWLNTEITDPAGSREVVLVGGKRYARPVPGETDGGGR